MHIGIGVFAHNEELRIAATLESLSRQDLFEWAGQNNLSVQIRVLANGCSDATVERSREACARLFALEEGVDASVTLIERAGKSNAWNEYVHRFCAPEADYLIFMDGDIQFVGSETLRSMVSSLEETCLASVAVDTILKDIVFSPQKTVLETISIRTSEMSRAGDPKIAGSLYVLRACVAKRIWLPLGLLVEDGFLKALILTDGLKEPENVGKIVRANGAAHTFEAESNLLALFRHEMRLMKGTTQNIILFGYLRRKLATSGVGDVGDLIRALNLADPHWVDAMTQAAVNARGWRVLPLQTVLLPLRQLTRLPRGSFQRYGIVCLLRSVFNGIALIGTYFDLRRGRLCW